MVLGAYIGHVCSAANKNKNVVTLLVDGVQAPEPGIGSAKVTAADTNDPLYIGGLPGRWHLTCWLKDTLK